MADVMARLSDRGQALFARSSDRGQLLLVTALALAVLLVTVALLLNAAIFTENVATRDTTTDGAEAIELRGELVTAVGDLIETENRDGGDTGDVEAGVDAMKSLVERERARHGVIANLTRNGSATPGELFRWDSAGGPRDFDDPGANWTFVEGVGNARGLVVNLTAVDSLSNPSPSDIEDEAFGVQFVVAGDNVTQYVYEDGGEIIVAEAVEGSDPEPQCTVTASGPTTLDLTGDRLRTDDSMTDCYRGLWPDDDPAAIRFVNGEDARGTASVTVASGSSPTVTPDPAVYSVTVDIGYQSSELDFETTVRVAPGEPQ